MIIQQVRKITTYISYMRAHLTSKAALLLTWYSYFFQLFCWVGNGHQYNSQTPLTLRKVFDIKQLKEISPYNKNLNTCFIKTPCYLGKSKHVFQTTTQNFPMIKNRRLVLYITNHTISITRNFSKTHITSFSHVILKPIYQHIDNIVL